MVEIFVENVSCNLADMTASSPFTYKFLATNLRKDMDAGIEVMLGICVENMHCATHVKRVLIFDLQTICATYDFVAPTEKIRAYAVELQSIFYKSFENYDLSQLKIISDARHEALLC